MVCPLPSKVPVKVFPVKATGTQLWALMSTSAVSVTSISLWSSVTPFRLFTYEISQARPSFVLMVTLLPLTVKPLAGCEVTACTHVVPER